MDERLEKALEFSNYMVTLNNQKRVLREKFRESSVFYHNGAQFTVTKQLVTFVSLLVDKGATDDVVLIDDNELPALVENLEDFLSDIMNTYFTAANSYHQEYQKLIKNRSTMKLVGYESE
jgi:hypothetical protein